MDGNIEKIKKERGTDLDKIRGCMIGGAAGDALGYAVEFSYEDQIFSKYGPAGITEYKTDRKTGKALISDDTQMSLFTACGLLLGDTMEKVRGITGKPRDYVLRTYWDWYTTQTSVYDEAKMSEAHANNERYSWLMDVPELYSRRAPGNTCLSALRSRDNIRCDYIKEPLNNSKGCGGVMRTAPAALMYRPGITYSGSLEKLDIEAAQIAALTHGHSMGYMPSAVLNHIISRILTDRDNLSLREIVTEAKDTVCRLFSDDPNTVRLEELINEAIKLSENVKTDIENIHLLGEGWVAEETLAIALYCALKYQDDFSAGIIAAVNHKGDSDSTGAVTGNILGAWLGFEAIDTKWKNDLELSDVILEIADDLCYGCLMEEYSDYKDPAWISKYMEKRRYPGQNKKQEYTFFWMDDEENGEFSNWYKSAFVYDCFQYLHVEQYMMAQKAKFFNDPERYTKILRAVSPKECKDLGKQVTPFDSKAWDKVKYEIVKTGSREKYLQNPDLMRKLLETGDSFMAEASPYDRIWGIGLNAKDAEKTDSEKWPGQNLMGKILMELRDEFME